MFYFIKTVIISTAVFIGSIFGIHSEKTALIPTPSVKISISPTAQQMVLDKKVATSPPTTPGVEPIKINNPVAEENLSDVAVKLYQSQIDVLKSAQSTIENNKRVYADIRHLWENQLTTAEVYLSSYPNNTGLVKDVELYKLLIKYSNDGVALLSSEDKKAEAAISFLLTRVEKYTNQKVSRNDMQSIFDDLEKIAKSNQMYLSNLDSIYKNYFDTNDKAAVFIDARHNVQAAQRQEYKEQIMQLQAEADRVQAYAQATIKQAQDTINATRTVYCTATRIGPGSVSVSCQ